MFGFGTKHSGQNVTKNSVSSAPASNRRQRRVLMLAALIGLGGMCTAAAPAQAHDRDYRDHDRGHFSVAVEADRRWASPVYETREERVWVEPTYRTVCDRVWVEDSCAVPQRVWVADRYEIRTREVGYGRSCRTIEERVLIEPGHWVLEAAPRPTGHWQNVDRQELVCAGHWETRARQIETSSSCYDDGPSRFHFGFGFGR